MNTLEIVEIESGAKFISAKRTVGYSDEREEVPYTLPTIAKRIILDGVQLGDIDIQSNEMTIQIPCAINDIESYGYCSQIVPEGADPKDYGKVYKTAEGAAKSLAKWEADNAVETPAPANTVCEIQGVPATKRFTTPHAGIVDLCDEEVLKGNVLHEIIAKRVTPDFRFSGEVL